MGRLVGRLGPVAVVGHSTSLAVNALLEGDLKSQWIQHRETALLLAAKGRGLGILDGSGMLVHQGALARIATCLGDAGISIDRMRQYRHETEVAPVLIVTHRTSRSSLREAIEAMQETGVLSGEPVALRIEEV